MAEPSQVTISDQDLLKIETERLPKHVAIIPDGNRRWAKAKGLPSLEGHRKGLEAVDEVLRFARDLGIHTATVWAFSTENWSRSQDEVSYLMQLFAESVERYLQEILDAGVRIFHLGRKDRIPDFLLKKIDYAEKSSIKNEKFVLNVALDYGGQDEILRAIGKILEEIKIGKLDSKDLSQEIGLYNGKYPIYLLSKYLDTKDQPFPYPDLVIRTSGEQRLSGFLPWQMAYSEIYFAQVHMPDFRKEEFAKAIKSFLDRNRRFGGN